ncbi:MAG: 4Fe-4S dicluster domain-containing protein, partial [Pseudomonadota bacterium]|nr:4Fe-4S dicluster domain-containing protein [Pseudomonadota bacterium]
LSPIQGPVQRRGIPGYPAGALSLVSMALSMAAFTLAFLGWLNESWLYLFESPIWLNRYTEYAIILAFSIWRIRAEQNPYTRKRLIILVTVVTGFWWLIPWLTPVFEPYAGYLWSQPVFPALHTPGTLTFFLALLLVFLFGRRVICGFGCPCVGIRETVGFPFRRFSLRGDWAWRLRHTKWFFFVWYVAVMVATQFPPNAWTATLVGMFALVVGLTYFGTFFITPITGNRFYCRYLCPYGATFGLLNHAGFYGIEMDTQRCIDCRRCEQACDMGIPVWRQGKTTGEVTGLEDCMGCARCIISCPTDALAIRDVRNLFRPRLRQDASHLLKRKPRPQYPE